MAGDSISGTFTGLQELQETLAVADNEMEYKGGRFALRKAAQVIRDAAKENSRRLNDPKTSEDIAENVVERWSNRTYKYRKEMMFRVGVLGGARQKAEVNVSGELRGAGKNNPGGDTFYWRFLEFGTSRIGARPFMRAAMEANTQAATNEYVAQFKKSVLRAIVAKAKKSAKARR